MKNIKRFINKKKLLAALLLISATAAVNFFAPGIFESYAALDPGHPWSEIEDFPADCGAGQFVSAIDTGTCSTPVGGVTGSGTANYIPLWTGGTALGNSIVTQSGTSINITGSMAASAGVSASSTGNAVVGNGANGVYGIGTSSGVYGNGVYGVYGIGSDKGVYGDSGATGVYGNGNAYGVYGNSAANVGVHGVGFNAGVDGYGTNYGVFGSGTTTGVYGTGLYGIYGVGTATGVEGFGASKGVYGNGGIYGIYGVGTSYDFYAAGSGANYAPFTGSHEVKLSVDFPKDVKRGMIVSVTGQTQVREDKDGEITISSTLPTVQLSNKTNDKTVFGVFQQKLPLPDDHWYDEQDDERFGIVNALGEGRVLVSNANGNIQVGDYITTSSISGYGQRQDDDLLHSYTLGKAIETVDWDSVIETMDFSGNKYKIYLIGVVYTSG